MPTVKDLTALCKAGRTQEAYKLATDDIYNGIPWAHKGLGWVIFYLVKEAKEKSDFNLLMASLNELKCISELNTRDDDMLFDNILLKIAQFTKDNIQPQSPDSFAKLSSLFAWLRQYDFSASKYRSFLLSLFIKFYGWDQMADFIDWWDLRTLTAEDYAPFKTQGGRKVLSLAERAYIAKSKALLLSDDSARKKAFAADLEALCESHPEMTYTNYFCGKLLVATGATEQEAIKAILPFARKKKSEFWVWQLLGEIFIDDPQKQMACLVRATMCKTKEEFLGKVRVKLASLYVLSKQFDKARFQIDKVTNCYLGNGWRLAPEVVDWIGSPWFAETTPDSTTMPDFKSITDGILTADALTAFAFVTYVSETSKKTALVYGQRKRAMLRLNIPTKPGDILKISFEETPDGKVNVFHAQQTTMPTGLTYAKNASGTVVRPTGKDFAFVKAGADSLFVSPAIVKEHDIKGGEKVEALAIMDYNRTRDNWNWVCAKLKRLN